MKKDEGLVNELIGRTLGSRYEIKEIVGEGGMARVYRGEDLKLSRPVAIKVLYEHFAGDAEFIRRFQQEAKAAARLSHPSIVNVYDEGEEDGVYYIIMEYLEGYTLKDIILRDGKLKAEEAMHIAYQICDALVHAHRQNVIHRDIKPQNIMITPEGRVKVADFGIARAATDSTITHGKSLMGSVYYSSPEQARGSMADQKSDIYSLGVVMYEMVTGELPFSGESPVSIALKHLQEDLVPPRQMEPEVPSEVEMIILRTMRKERNMRYRSAAELLEDLEEWLQGQGKDNYVKGTLKNRLQAYESEARSKEDEKGQSAGDAGGKPVNKITSYFDDDYSNVDYSDEEYDYEDEDEEDGEGFPVKKALLYGSLLAVLFFVIWLGYGFVSGLVSDIFEVPEVTVPDLEGLSLEEAERALQDEGLDFVIEGEAHSDTVPEDHVVSQNPLAGRSVRQERAIELVISLGPDKVEVPDLVGRTEREARLILQDLDLEVDLSEEHSDDVEAGYIIRQDPGTGFELTRDETVRVVVSKGKKPFSLRNFHGWDIKDAREWLNLYDLVERNVDKEHSDEVGEDKVISQHPDPGTMVQKGDPVDLVVSKGSEPVEHEVHPLTIAPEVELGQVIRVDLDDEEGRRTIFEGEFAGEAVSMEVIGSGQVILMELRDDEYVTIDTFTYPQAEID